MIYSSAYPCRWKGVVFYADLFLSIETCMKRYYNSITSLNRAAAAFGLSCRSCVRTAVVNNTYICGVALISLLYCVKNGVKRFYNMKNVGFQKSGVQIFWKEDGNRSQTVYSLEFFLSYGIGRQYLFFVILFLCLKLTNYVKLLN